jgi:hypothetical protein
MSAIVIPPTPQAREAWFNSLTPAAQTELIARTEAVYRGLPMVLQQVLQRYLIANGENPPLAPALDGYNVAVGGLGQWADMAMALAQMGTQIGTSLYNSKENAQLQSELQSNALASNQAIVNAQNQAALQAQQIIADAQRETAAQASAAIQSQSQTGVFGGMSTSTKVGLAIGALASVVLVGYFVTHKKR